MFASGYVASYVCHNRKSQQTTETCDKYTMQTFATLDATL